MAYCPGDNGNWLSSFEEECVSDLESDGDHEQQLLVDKELAARRLWLTFQNSANAVSHFYRGELYITLSIFNIMGVINLFMKQKLCFYLQCFKV